MPVGIGVRLADTAAPLHTEDGVRNGRAFGRDASSGHRGAVLDRLGARVALPRVGRRGPAALAQAEDQLAPENVVAAEK